MPGMSAMPGIFIDIVESIGIGIPFCDSIRCSIGSVITRSRITGSDIMRMKIAIMRDGMLSPAMPCDIDMESMGIESIAIEPIFMEFMFIEVAANPPHATVADILSVAVACTAMKYCVSLPRGVSRCAAAVAFPCASTARGGNAVTAPIIP